MAAANVAKRNIFRAIETNRRVLRAAIEGGRRDRVCALAGSGSDTLIGGGGDDELGHGSDFSAERGDDTLDGGLGNDNAGQGPRRLRRR